MRQDVGVAESVRQRWIVGRYGQVALTPCLNNYSQNPVFHCHSRSPSNATTPLRSGGAAAQPVWWLCRLHALDDISLLFQKESCTVLLKPSPHVPGHPHIVFILQTTSAFCIRRYVAQCSSTPTLMLLNPNPHAPQPQPSCSSTPTLMLLNPNPHASRPPSCIVVSPCTRLPTPSVPWAKTGPGRGLAAPRVQPSLPGFRAPKP